ncbi:uncharacterized protein N7518_005873 [Penicillium psychrosexuale]|uniref:uncharacterized protein n=1 Tax=Penicillium psychrosexuale TaxID=1002107 RepID=UPI0025456958|nr:uncharacterized protein N7518_005873 [Penicillium psychrosexuale]KAJ5788862.1 hypothetical protein N7518_005873 [Penicillium psychrosexuale]
MDFVKEKQIGSFSLIERVILSAGAMLIFFVYFRLTICPEGTPVWGRNVPPTYSGSDGRIWSDRLLCWQSNVLKHVKEH